MPQEAQGEVKPTQKESIDQQISSLRDSLQKVTTNLIAIGDELNHETFTQGVEKEKLYLQAKLVLEQDKVATQLELKEFEYRQGDIVRDVQGEVEHVLLDIKNNKTEDPQKSYNNILLLVNRNLLLALKSKQPKSILELLRLLNYVNKYKPR